MPIIKKIKRFVKNGEDMVLHIENPVSGENQSILYNIEYSKKDVHENFENNSGSVKIAKIIGAHHCIAKPKFH